MVPVRQDSGGGRLREEDADAVHYLMPPPLWGPHRLQPHQAAHCEFMRPRPLPAPTGLLAAGEELRARDGQVGAKAKGKSLPLGSRAKTP